MRDPETYKESETTYPALTVEYPIWLYLTADPPPRLVDEQADAQAMQRVIDLTQEIITVSRYYYLANGFAAAASDHDLAIEELRFEPHVEFDRPVARTAVLPPTA